MLSMYSTLLLSVIIMIGGGVNVKSTEKVIVNVSAFLSGCFPVALIEWIRVVLFRTSNNNWYVEIFSKTFFTFTIVCSLIFWVYILKKFREANTIGEISCLKRKDMFSSGAVSYYILPFVSFLGNDINSMVTLIVVIILLAVIYNNNMMFMYTPLLDFMGFKVLEGNIKCQNAEFSKAMILVKKDKNIVFTGENKGKFEKIQEGLYFFIMNQE